MRSRLQAVVLPFESGEFGEDVRQIFAELGRSFGDVLAGECSPAVDVYETDSSVEVSMDLPDVDPAFVRILAKGQTIVIAGDKAPRRGRGDSSYHLVERGYGRFARAIRLTASCDTGKAVAQLKNGELRLSLPKVPDRRGRTIRIAVTGGQPVR